MSFLHLLRYTDSKKYFMFTTDNCLTSDARDLVCIRRRCSELKYKDEQFPLCFASDYQCFWWEGNYTLMIPWSLLFQETLDFVSYVAKDLVNGRACHVLECGGGLSEDVITTIGQAFELRFKEYLKNQPKAMEIPDR